MSMARTETVLMKKLSGARLRGADVGAVWLIPIVVVLADYEKELWEPGAARRLYGDYPPTQSGRVPELSPAPIAT